MQMMIIRSDTPLFLHTLRDLLLKLWRQAGIESAGREEGEELNGRARLAQAEVLEQRDREVKAGLSDFLKRAESYRSMCPSGVWEKETEALQRLWTAMPGETPDRSPRILVQPLIIPARLPIAALPLLEGWHVREDPSIPVEQFSPLALLWLKQVGAKPVETISGKVASVEAREGVAVASVDRDGPAGYAEPGTGIPVVSEYREHSMEHIDDGMLLLQANVDDSSPEWMAHAMERLLEAGANDVHFLPVTMKKSRPGVLVQVLCYQSRLEELKTVLFQETTTFGIRYFPVSCHRLARRFVTVQTAWGEVPVKIGIHHGRQVQYSPEYAVCARLAKEAGIPVKQVHQEALLLALKMR
ncbi:nickel insertion protein [Brevibacillus borstelensis]|uniref:nickel insertion protein n=1 Tax=Brevibacillus borstelensis TaxID=45462 RepID=UPI0030C056E8